MIAALSFTPPLLFVIGIMVVLGLGVLTVLLLLDVDVKLKPLHSRHLAYVEQERDLAGALGWPWRRWVAMRLGALAVAVIVAVLSGIAAVGILVTLVAVFGLRFAVAGRAAKRRLRMERAFLAQLRILRDRMAIANQSLDTSLIDMANSPPGELVHVLKPLTTGGSIRENLVAVGERSRSPLIEQACALLLWARTRSLDALISAIDDVLLPVGEAQLAVEEESLVTLSQQRAVTFAMAGLIGFMFASVLRVDSFRAYYGTLAGTIVLVASILLFFLLIFLLGRILRTASWTRWNLRQMLEQETRPHA